MGRNNAKKIKSLNETEIEISFTKHQKALQIKKFKTQVLLKKNN